LLGAFDAQVRARIPDRLPQGVQVELDGPLVRFLNLDNRGFVEYRDLAGLEGAELDELIARQVRFFESRGESFEWKTYGHDAPADLADRLRAAGFVPEEQETLLIARAAEIATGPGLPGSVDLRQVTEIEDLQRMEEMEHEIWGSSPKGMAERLKAELVADPAGLTVVVAEAGGEVVCGAWIRFEEGTEFVTLWGGATLPAWRRRGIYRAMVAYRARLAVARGFRYLQVDASDNSRPILERLGFAALTTTTPFIWSPPE
jgi:GNAT superfamily N-acetyltransferase